MVDRSSFTRRSFLKSTSVLAAAPFAAGLPASALGAVLGAGDTVRLAWIGVGGRGTSLLEGALNNASESKLRVTAICDIDPAARDRAIGKCGAMKPVGVADYRELLSREDIDAIFVATPIHLHAEHAAAAVSAGKHCYCEKPLGRSPEDVKKIVDAVKKSGRKFQVGFQWRYQPAFLAFVEQVQSGAIGKVSFLDGIRHVGGYPDSGWFVDRELSGDLIVEQAVHEMNVLCWMLDGSPLRACGFGGIKALKEQPPGRTIMDSYAVVFEFADDIRVNYSHVIYAARGFGGLYFRVYGDRGKACQLDGTVDLSVTKDGNRTKIELPELTDATEAAIRSFVDCVRSDKEPLAGIEAGRRATLTAILARTAMHERRVVEWKEVALEG